MKMENHKNEITINVTVTEESEIKRALNYQITRLEKKIEEIKAGTYKPEGVTAGTDAQLIALNEARIEASKGAIAAINAAIVANY